MSTTGDTTGPLVVEFWAPPQGKKITAVPFDLSEWEGVPRQLLVDLAEGLAAALGPDGTWEELVTAENGVGNLKWFAQLIARDSDGSDRTAVTRLSEFTGDHWNDLLLELPQPGDPGWNGTQHRLVMARVVLRGCTTLPSTTRRRIEWQIGSKTAHPQETYPVELQKLVLELAWEHLMRRRDEIVENFRLWCTSRDELSEPEQVKWDGYNDLLTGHDKLQTPARRRAVDPDGAWVPKRRESTKAAKSVASKRWPTIRRQLFLGWEDALAIMTLLAGAHGKSLQSIIDMEEPRTAASFADPVKFLQSTTHKNRRGKGNKHLDTMAAQFSDYGRLQEVVQLITAPARHLLRTHYEDADANRLLLFWRRSGRPVPLPDQISDANWWLARQTWLAGTGIESLTASQLKRTHQTVWGGVKADKTVAELDQYWRRLSGSADALDQKFLDALTGLHDAAESVTFAGDVVTSDNPAGLAETEQDGLDIANFSTGCRRPSHQPTTFLTCYDCPLAVLTESMIPMNVLILDRLRDLQDSPGPTTPNWDGYGASFLRVRDGLLRLHVDDDELDEYRNEATAAERQAVDDMFSGLHDEAVKLGGVRV